MSAFEELGVCPELISALEREDWLLPTPIQAETIPLILGGGDVCAAAETGSGKTGAFGLPSLQVVHETLRNKALLRTDFNKGDPSKVEVKLNPNDKDPAIFVYEDGNKCSSNEERKWNGIRGTVDAISGCYMYEITLLMDGLIRVGFGTQSCNRIIGLDAYSFGYGGTGKKSWNSKFENYGESFGYGDTIGCLLNRQTQTISFKKNGKFLGIAYTLSKNLYSVGLYPTVCGKKFQIHCRFDTFLHPEEGYKSWISLSPQDSLILRTTISSSSSLNKISMGGSSPLCIVLEPTRDLAKQTFEVLSSFAASFVGPKLRLGLFLGGVDERNQREILSSGVEICVGTVFKIMDYIRRQLLHLHTLKILILDEADDLIKNDEKGDISRLRTMASSHGSLQTLFFSSTLHSPAVKAAVEILTNSPMWIDLKGKPTVPSTVHSLVISVDPSQKYPSLTPSSHPSPPTDGIHFHSESSHELIYSERIKILKPQILIQLAESLKMTQCLIFCRTNLDCENLGRFLTALGGGRAFSGKAETGKENPFSCAVLAGMQTQAMREANLEHFKQGDIRFLICTDVAARGLHIEKLPFLVMMTLPDESDQFFHRVGRVGRAEKIGLAISIVSTKKERVCCEFDSKSIMYRYHKCPNRGKNCHKTQLISEGGCTIWYDEGTYLKAITESLGEPLTCVPLEEFLSTGLDRALSSLSSVDEIKVKRPRTVTIQDLSTCMKIENLSAIYGKARNDQISFHTTEYMAALFPVVDELTEMEQEVQRQFLVHQNFGIQGLR
ncbi:putative ATP-dependent Rna helicase DDX1 [Cardiosporidium cionae]|uniref:DEAD box protein 1 n=1 Tax=Cardiosporidium cionae TaxID=476202 RepID=A0ABQ7J985_9APIC|nr:putative ATP-dependent Rna helicase DDX1 [Cardiosporidium cionae]|eukprot:KAF8820530.1 putative ATP-dependent Rna helicase DDX1 [Cardiosporidium cionae]